MPAALLRTKSDVPSAGSGRSQKNEGFDNDAQRTWNLPAHAPGHWAPLPKVAKIGRPAAACNHRDSRAIFVRGTCLTREFVTTAIITTSRTRAGIGTTCPLRVPWPMHLARPRRGWSSWYLPLWAREIREMDERRLIPLTELSGIHDRSGIARLERGPPPERIAAMPSPFPGMNPYIEQDVFWQDFHREFLPAMRTTGRAVAAEVHRHAR